LVWRQNSREGHEVTIEPKVVVVGDWAGERFP
jgi:hypothetical protein